MRANKCGHRIRVARTTQNPRLTQDDLVAKLQINGVHISKNTLSRIEIGDRYVTDLELLAFAKILGVTTNWLLEECSDPYKR